MVLAAQRAFYRPLAVFLHPFQRGHQNYPSAMLGDCCHARGISDVRELATEKKKIASGCPFCSMHPHSMPASVPVFFCPLSPRSVSNPIWHRLNYASSSRLFVPRSAAVRLSRSCGERWGFLPIGICRNRRDSTPAVLDVTRIRPHDEGPLVMPES